MCERILKTGSVSILLGSLHYGSFVPIKKNKLLKIGKKCEKHNEFKHLNLVREIENYDLYYSIPEEEINIINPTDKLYKYLMLILKNEKINIFRGQLEYYYIDYAGDKDLLDIISDINELGYSNSFTNWKDILLFTYQILKGLTFLHEKHICHLDIKPENIVVNYKTFKIIDFGFCSQEPFNEYVNDLSGTPGYFPKQYRIDKPTPWLPRITANDGIPVNNKIPMQENRKLVYKIDSYCFGRTLNVLVYMFIENIVPSCFCQRKNKNYKKVQTILSDLLEDDVNKRKHIKDVLREYF